MFPKQPPLNQKSICGIQRWLELGSRSGPFKPVGEGKETDNEVDEFVEDRNGNRLVFILGIEKQPKLKITLLSVRPAYMIEGPPTEFRNWDNLTTLAGQIAAYDASPGFGIAVLHNGKLTVAVTGNRRSSDRERIELDDVWNIGSIGKSLCATVIGILIERGKLRWDETLGEALPDFPKAAGYEHVTLEQLMHHRGGVPADLTFTKLRSTKL